MSCGGFLVRSTPLTVPVTCGVTVTAWPVALVAVTAIVYWPAGQVWPVLPVPFQV